MLVSMLALAAVLLRDELGRPPMLGWLPGWVLGLVFVGGLAVLWVLQHLVLLGLGRRIDRTGSWRAVAWSDRVVRWSRGVAVGWHVVAVLGFGWLDVVRRVVGDAVLLDELLAVGPVLGFVAAGWWSVYPIERRLREAVLFRNLEDGLPLNPPMERGAFVWMNVRHQLGLVLLGALPLMAWSETVLRLMAALIGHSTVIRSSGPSAVQRLGLWLQDPGVQEWTRLGLQGAAAIVVLSMLPTVLRRVWDTTAIQAGELRDDLIGVCSAHRVKVRELLVWRTQGTVINGAVLGLLGRWRYVLLTDALLERLPGREVLAVMAHEVGHVRHRHLPWLAMAMLASGGAIFAALDELARLLPILDDQGGPGGVAGSAAILAVGVGATVVCFGWVSRRFEWQADAFAVQHLSGARRGVVAPLLIADDAVFSMADALDRVARLNHLDPRAFSFRHGSIAERVRRLHNLRGRRVDTLSIDRTVRVMKMVIAVLLAGVLALAIWQSVGAAAGASAGSAWW
jgi:STE24 endopeptidase